MKGFLILGLILIVLIANASVLAQNTVRLSIATGGTGGIFYPIGSGVAGLISKHVPNVQAAAEVTSGSIDNCLLLNGGKTDLALAVADTAWDAYQGRGKRFRERVPLRTVAAVYPVFMHLVALENRGIEKVTDLKEKAVSTGAPGSWTELTSVRILEAIGLNPDKNMKRFRLGPSESSANLRGKKMDAYFWGGGIPSASVTDLGASLGGKIRLVPLDDVVPLLKQKHGDAYVKGSIPAGTYPVQHLAVPTLLVWNLLVCHEKMRDDLAYQIVKSIFEHRPELVAIQGEAKFLTLEAQSEGVSPIPYHPGAARYFGERGIRVR